jgi:hypothetical protein
MAGFSLEGILTRANLLDCFYQLDVFLEEYVVKLTERYATRFSLYQRKGKYPWIEMNGRISPASGREKRPPSALEKSYSSL